MHASAGCRVGKCNEDHIDNVVISTSSWYILVVLIEHMYSTWQEHSHAKNVLLMMLNLNSLWWCISAGKYLNKLFEPQCGATDWILGCKVSCVLTNQLGINLFSGLIQIYKCVCELKMISGFNFHCLKSFGKWRQKHFWDTNPSVHLLWLNYFAHVRERIGRFATRAHSTPEGCCTIGKG